MPLPALAGGVGRMIAQAGTSVRLSVALEGYEKIDVALSRLGDRVSDYRPFWTEYFAPQFFGDVQRNFETQGAYVGGWPHLSPGYAAWKQANYPGKPIMVLHGPLKESLTWRDGRVGRGGVFRATTDAAELGTNIPYAAKHQHGDGNLPQRRLLFLNSSETYGRLLHRYLVDSVRESGLRSR